MRVAFVSPEPTPYRAPLLDRVAALPLRLLRNGLRRVEQVRAKDHVGIHEATERKAGNLVRERQRGVKPRRAMGGQLEAGHVLDVQLAGGLCDVAEQEHLDAERAPDRKSVV